MTDGEAPSFDAPETAALRHEFRQVAERHIDALPAQYRIVFVLRRLEGYKHGEIARHLGISVSAVEKHMVRAIGHLSTEMGKRHAS